MDPANNQPPTQAPPPPTPAAAAATTVPAQQQTKGQTSAFAGVLTRFIAVFIDGLVVGIPIGLVTFLMASLMGEPTPAITLPLQLLLSFGYFVVYQAKAGQTLGKKAMHIKVVDEKGQTPTILKFFLREIIGKWISALILGIGYLIAIFDSRKQALHDKIAGTFVIKV